MKKPTTILQITAVKLLAVFLFLFYSANPSSAEPTIENIGVHTDGHFVVLDAQMKDGLTDSIIEAINSGIPMTFTYKIELLEIVPLWADKIIHSNTVSNTVHFDALKKVYRFSSIGRNVQRKIMTRKKEKYKTLMSSLKSIPVASIKILDANQKYFIRLKADVETDRFWFPFNYLFFFVPFNDIKTSWAESSTLIWKPKVEQASNSGNKKIAKKKSRKPKVFNHDVIRTFNE